MVDVTTGLPDSLYFTASVVSHSNPLEVWVTAGGFADGVKVFHSTDGGDNWENVSYNLPNIPINAIVHQANSPNNTIYIGTDIGVYLLNENELEWKAFSTDLPNVIVSDLVINPSTEQIYAATFGRGIWVSDLEETISTSTRLALETIAVDLSPNPNHGQFELALDNLSVDQLQIQIVDITGRTVFTEQIQNPPLQLRKNFQLNLNYGLYFLRLSSGKKGRVIKFVVD